MNIITSTLAQGGVMSADEISPELREAVMKTFYHHPRSSPEIVRMITGKTFEVPPPQPTAEEKRMAHEIVEHLVALHYSTFREACIKVLGEDPEDWV